MGKIYSFRQIGHGFFGKYRRLCVSGIHAQKKNGLKIKELKDKTNSFLAKGESMNSANEFCVCVCLFMCV